MKFSGNRKNRKILIWVVCIILSLALIFGACAIYVSDYYRADQEAIHAFFVEKDVFQTTLDDGTIVFDTGNSDFGFIFYPGGKVEYTAYVPLMRALAAKGIRCFLIKMPFNLAVLDMNAAEGIIEAYPDVKDWYIGGHSLGGSMAACYVADNARDFRGLVLLGSYSSEDISNTDIEVISIYGSEDGILNREKYEKYRDNLSDGLCEIVIEGGNHAYFGMYGAQKGDGAPSVTNEEQISFTAEQVYSFISNNGGEDAKDN